MKIRLAAATVAALAAPLVLPATHALASSAAPASRTTITTIKGGCDCGVFRFGFGPRCGGCGDFGFGHQDRCDFGLGGIGGIGSSLGGLGLGSGLGSFGLGDPLGLGQNGCGCGDGFALNGAGLGLPL